MSGKGDTPRPVDHRLYRENYDRIFKKLDVSTEEWSDEGEKYCIMQPQNPNWSLCGLHLPDEIGMDDDEVPTEITCPECLAIRAREDQQKSKI